MFNIPLFALGHVIRDGWPSFKRFTSGLLGTHAARITGSLVCSFGLLFSNTWYIALVLWLTILVGFYLDQKHGEGQGAETGQQARWLQLSGFTSCLLTTLAFVALGYFINDIYYVNAFMTATISLFKPAIWWAFQHFMPQKYVPTRWAAGTFGALYGAAVGI